MTRAVRFLVFIASAPISALAGCTVPRDPTK
jgi:hypothetical protein